jgi:hypothetical protein
MRDALVVECPAYLLIEVRQGDVLQQGRVHDDLQITFLPQRPHFLLRHHK